MTSSSATPPYTDGQPAEPAVLNGRYEIRSQIGSTSWSNDYRARDLLLDRDVVFKALRPELVGDKGFIERFRAQAQAAANLTHPALASVFDWGRDPNGLYDLAGPTYYLVAEALGGRTVRDLVDANGAMPIDRALHVLVSVTSALSYANRAGVIHGGVSPENVTITTNGVVKVSDVGLALALGSLWQPSNDKAKDAYWRSPELTRGETADGRTDVYNVGLLGYFLLTGRAPFPGDTASQVAERHRSVIPPAPSKINGRIPKPLESIIGRSLAKNPAERYDSASEMRAAFVRFRESRAALQSDPPVVREPVHTSASADERPDFSPPDFSAPDFSPASNSGTSAASDLTTVADVGRLRNQSQDFASPDNDQTQVLVRQTGAIKEELATQSLGAPRGNFDELTKPTKRSSKGLFAVLLILLAALAGLLFLLAKQFDVFGSAKSTVTVPDVRGKVSADAESTISAAGLNVEVQEEPSATVAQQQVIDQSPAAGLKVPAGSKVILHVSTGVAKPIVPRVIGETIDGARAKLSRAGFAMELAEKQDDTAEAGTVISQEPRPDSESTPGATVTITVATSSGTVPIPDVTQLTPDDARLALTKALFRITVQTEASQTVDAGKVIRTEPAGGQRVDRGAAVVIIVSGGNATQVPDLRGKTQADAEQTLNALGLKIDVTTRAVVNADEVGTVITQTPVAGKEIDPGATVSVRVGILDTAQVTKKPKVTTPDTAPETTPPPTEPASVGGAVQVVPSVAPVSTVAPEPPPVVVVPAASPEPTIAPA